MPPKIDKQTHPIYTKISRFISNDIPKEMLPDLESEREVILEKAAILYNAAMDLPRAYLAIKQDAKNNVLYNKVKQKGGKDKLDKDGEDALLYKYIDVADYIRLAYDNYSDRYFASSISIFASKAMAIIKKDVEQTLKEGIEQTLKPKKSVTIREDLTEKVKITGIATNPEVVNQGDGEWVKKVKRKLPINQIPYKPPGGK
jgi:hypothetical protein